MRCLTLVLFCVVLLLAPFSARAQVAPSAYKRSLTISAGGEASVFQPDYAGNGYAETAPNRLYGIGAYIDARFSRWVQIEGEGRWLHFNEYRGPNNESPGIGQNTYMIGPRVPIIDFHRWEPYGKFLFGWGSGTNGWLSGRATAWAYGGGVEYQWKKRITVRPFDFEYQQWRVTPTLRPYGASAGLSYVFF